jgi:DNA-binding NarL/FixJ family response regulator
MRSTGLTGRPYLKECRTRIVVLTVSPNNVDLFEARLAGAAGYLLKDVSAARLPAALCAVLAGEAAMPRAMVRRLIEEFRAREARHRGRRRFMPGRRRVRAELTAREREVLVLTSEHLPSTVVAQRLGISEVTVRRHVSSAMHKLDVPNRASAVQLGSDESATGWPEGSAGMRVDVARRRRPLSCTVALALAAS